MAKLVTSGGTIEVPSLFLGGVIEAGDLIDQVNSIFKKNSDLLQTNEEAFLSRPLADIYRIAGLILQIAEISCHINDIEFSAKDWLNKKVRPQDINSIYVFFFDLMSESGFGASGEKTATTSTQDSQEDSVATPKKGRPKSK